RIQHLALAEGQVLVALQQIEVTQHLGDLEDGACLDLLHVLPVPAIPRGGINRDVLLPEDGIDLLDVLLADDLPEANGAHLVDRDHDPHPVFQDAQHVEGLTLPRYLGVLDSHDFAHTLARVDCLVASLKARLHSYRLLELDFASGTRSTSSSYHKLHPQSIACLDPVHPDRLAFDVSL